jgi:uncharacterized protein YbcI
MDARFDDQFGALRNANTPLRKIQQMTAMLRSLSRHVIETGKMPDAEYIETLVGKEIAEHYRKTDPDRLVKIIGEHLIDMTASLDFGAKDFTSIKPT